MTPVEFQALEKADLNDRIVERIRSEIISGSYVPGDLLPSERDLAVQLQVNRTTVREALNSLEHLGLVERRQGLGCRVLEYRQTGSLDLLPHLLVGPGGVGLDLENVRSLVEFGTVYWSFSARLASERATRHDLESLERSVHMAEAAFDASDRAGAEAALRRLYSGVITATHSIVPELIRNTFLAILDTQIDSDGSVFGGLASRGIEDSDSRSAHRDLFEAIEARSADAAEQAIRRGLRELELVLIQRSAR